MVNAQQNEKVKFTLYVTKEMKDWYEEESKRDGIPQNSLILLAMKIYKETREKAEKR